MLRRLLIMTMCALAPALAARAEDWPIQGVAAFELLGGYPVDGGQMVAARIRMKPGWKTYWRAPGGNGIPPRFDWSGSQNLGTVSFLWPEPKVFRISGVRTIGYTDELVLPVRITPRNPGQPIRLRGQVAFGVCDDICLPVATNFDVSVDGTRGSGVAAIKQALAKAPLSARAAGVSGVACAISKVADGFRIAARFRLPSARDGQFTIVEFPHPDVWVEQAATRVEGAQVTAEATLYPLSDAPLVLDRSRLRLTVLGGARAVEISGCPAG